MSIASGTWDKKAFPYDTDYCDHFETPQRAYDDIASLLDSLALISPVKTSKRAHVTVYDPYYCDGRSGRLLRDLGFQVKHEKRDFYKDIQDDKVPQHDLLVTNPPFSDQHKKKCLQFCFEQLRGPDKRPFALLMPNYVAAREYYKKLLRQQQDAKEDVVYFVPSTTYHYDHPDGTGKDKPPFESLWFIGVNNDKNNKQWRKEWPGGRIVESLDDLSKFNAAFQLMFQNRPNPRQRRKMNRKRVMEMEKTDLQSKETQQSASLKPRKKSKYRDETGNRRQGRF